MATLKTIRKRISSVKNTQKITRAMRMVAAAKLKKMQSALMQARPYAEMLKRVLTDLASHIDFSAEKGKKFQPFFKGQEDSEHSSGSWQQRIAEMTLYTSDRGLCGGFNSNLLRKVQLALSLEMKAFKEVRLNVLGRKGCDYFKAKKISLHQAVTDLASHFSFSEALEKGKEVLKEFQEESFQNYFIVYNGFKSAISQEVRIEQILPILIPPLENRSSPTEQNLVPPLCEPSLEELLEDLIPRYLASQFYIAFLESSASELGAKMAAMESATNNAKEMIGKLTLQYNRARQAMITKELMDIVNGAESIQ